MNDKEKYVSVFAQVFHASLMFTNKGKGLNMNRVP